MTTNRLLFRVFLSRLLPLLVLALAGSAAMAQTDPPARVASLSHMEGSVVLAPAGDTEWTDAVLNRPITRGDRLWTDRGARAEVHLGSAVLHMDSETFLDVTALDDQVLQASLNEGTVNARVRELQAGENFEIDTPHLAFRASQPGDYRIDVDPARGITRVTVRSGIALVYGASGEAQQLQAGQQIAFAGRDLERVAVQGSASEDGFDRWAADRNHNEDQSIAARYVPRELVGYQQLDPYGTWAQDASYGPVWFPRITVADWAPYRYGHWEWIVPWGWTWIDDAPWGFAPFHYGRWAVIGSRWCWVPGRIGPRPIYSPALVAFVGGVGGRSSWNLSVGSRPGIAWYPLAPGEAWRPTYRTSPVYVRNVNRNIVVSNNAPDAHLHRGRGEALTAVRVEDFSRGRPVHRHWTRVNPAEIARAPLASLPAMPEPPRFGEAGRAGHARAQPPAQAPSPVVVGRPQPQFVPPGADRRERGDRGRPAFRAGEDWRQQQQPRRHDEQRSLMETPRAQPERSPQFQAGPRVQPERLPQARHDERLKDEQNVRDEQRRQQAQQLQLQQLERARRDQQVQQERVLREQQLHAQRQVEEQQRAQQAQLQREHALRQQQALQERLQHQQEQQQRAMQQQQQAAQHQQHAPQPQFAAPAVVQSAPMHRGEGRERAAERVRQAQDERDERRTQGDDDGRGRGRGHGRGG